eukprot:UC4_evm5s1233
MLHSKRANNHGSPSDITKTDSTLNTRRGTYSDMDEKNYPHKIQKNHVEPREKIETLDFTATTTTTTASRSPSQTCSTSPVHVPCMENSTSNDSSSTLSAGQTLHASTIPSGSYSGQNHRREDNLQANDDYDYDFDHAREYYHENEYQLDRKPKKKLKSKNNRNYAKRYQNRAGVSKHDIEIHNDLANDKNGQDCDKRNHNNQKQSNWKLDHSHETFYQPSTGQKNKFRLNKNDYHQSSLRFESSTRRGPPRPQLPPDCQNSDEDNVTYSSHPDDCTGENTSQRKKNWERENNWHSNGRNENESAQFYVAPRGGRKGQEPSNYFAHDRQNHLRDVSSNYIRYDDFRLHSGAVEQQDSGVAQDEHISFTFTLPRLPRPSPGKLFTIFALIFLAIQNISLMNNNMNMQQALEIQRLRGSSVVDSGTFSHADEDLYVQKNVEASPNVLHDETMETQYKKRVGLALEPGEKDSYRDLSNIDPVGVKANIEGFATQPEAGSDQEDIEKDTPKNIPLGVSYSYPRGSTHIKTNLLVIIADQVPAYAVEKQKMDNLQNYLVSKGFVFTSAYAPGMACIPSRGSILTGLHVGRHGIRIRYTDMMKGPQMPDACANGPRVALDKWWGTGSNISRIVNTMPWSYDQVIEMQEAEPKRLFDYEGKMHSWGYFMLRRTDPQKALYMRSTFHKQYMPGGKTNPKHCVEYSTWAKHIKSNIDCGPRSASFSTKMDYLYACSLKSEEDIKKRFEECNILSEKYLIPNRTAVCSATTKDVLPSFVRKYTDPKSGSYQLVANVIETMQQAKRNRVTFSIHASLEGCHDPHVASGTHFNQQLRNIEKGNIKTTSERSTVRNIFMSQLLQVDQDVGKIMKELDTLDLASKTLVIFTADHGSQYDSDLRIFAKTNEYSAGPGSQHYKKDEGDWARNILLAEGTKRVPLIIKPPLGAMGVKPGPALVHTPVSLVDLFPTILQFIIHNSQTPGLGWSEDYKFSFDGKTLVPLMKEAIHLPSLSQGYPSPSQNIMNEHQCQVLRDGYSKHCAHRLVFFDGRADCILRMAQWKLTVRLTLPRTLKLFKTTYADSGPVFPCKVPWCTHLRLQNVEHIDGDDLAGSMETPNLLNTDPNGKPARSTTQWKCCREYDETVLGSKSHTDLAQKMLWLTVTEMFKGVTDVKQRSINKIVHKISSNIEHESHTADISAIESMMPKENEKSSSSSDSLPSLHNVKNTFIRKDVIKERKKVEDHGDASPVNGDIIPIKKVEIDTTETEVNANDLQKVGWYVHMPKTGGTTINHRIRCIVDECLNADGPLGKWTFDPPRSRLVHANMWLNICNKMSINDDINIDQSNTVSKCQPAPPGFRAKDVGTDCPYNHHWLADVNRKLRREVEKKGMRPIPIGSVRNPFSYYVSVYFFGLYEQRASSGRRLGGIDILGTKHDKCLQDPRGNECVTIFRNWLTYKFKDGWCMKKTMENYYGRSLSLVPSWAWIKQENLEEDLTIIHKKLTGTDFKTKSVADCLKRTKQDGSPRDSSKHSSRRVLLAPLLIKGKIEKPRRSCDSTYYNKELVSTIVTKDWSIRTQRNHFSKKNNNIEEMEKRIIGIYKESLVSNHSSRTIEPLPQNFSTNTKRN